LWGRESYFQNHRGIIIELYEIYLHWRTTATETAAAKVPGTAAAMGAATETATETAAATRALTATVGLQGEIALNSK
jgi:hypothetical protein